MPRTGERHRHAAFVCSGDHFRVFYRTTRLNRRRRTRFRSGDQSVREREERVTAHHAAVQRELRLTRFPDCDATGIHATHLSCAHTESAVVGAVKNGVRFEMLHHAPAEQHRFQLSRCRLTFRHDLQLSRARHFQIALLHEK